MGRRTPEIEILMLLYTIPYPVPEVYLFNKSISHGQGYLTHRQFSKCIYSIHSSKRLPHKRNILIREVDKATDLWFQL